MKKIIAAIGLLVLVGVVAPVGAADKADVDLCKGAVDPYEPMGQKTLFFTAAGKDNELSEEEFNADKTKGKGFVRSFEKWSTIVAFDKDGKKQIDWLEADAYRRDLRKRVLAAFDASKDGKLAGDERTAANKALAAGKFASVRRRSSRGSSRESYWDRPESIKQHDTDKDGKLSDAEKDAARKAYQARRELQYYDKNKDGKLDKKEIAERDKGRAERAKRDAEREKVRKEIYEKFDKNKNGKFDEDERAAVGEYFRNRRYDRNRDGKLDEKETAARDKDNAERAKRRAAEVKRFDKDGDGKLNEEEEKAHRDSHRGDRRGGRGRGGRGRGGRGGSDRGGRDGGDQ
jgi:Ca2+-binding EF-hand superfamily protein